jgi:hypothetical protein
MKGLVAFLALAGLALSGCIVHAHRGHGHVHGPPVVIAAGHVHSAHCGHYYHRGNWHHHHGHVHAAGCGHLFRGGIWIIAD